MMAELWLSWGGMSVVGSEVFVQTDLRHTVLFLNSCKVAIIHNCKFMLLSMAFTFLCAWVMRAFIIYLTPWLPLLHSSSFQTRWANRSRKIYLSSESRHSSVLTTTNCFSVRMHTLHMLLGIYINKDRKWLLPECCLSFVSKICILVY